MIARLSATDLTGTLPANAAETPRKAPGEVLEALKEFDARFDETVGLVGGLAPDMHYHTTLKPGAPVHLTRDSAEYAFGLLESGEPWRVARGNAILRQLAELQDTCGESRTYGIWSWFYEEPLERMSPPDWNWADFIGTQLIQATVRNGGRLEPEVRERIAAAIGHAARSIIRRNVGMDYTNIALMGTYVTVMAGEILGDGEILDYGRERLRRFARFTREWGGFPEYNSPNYTVVALTEILRMLRDFTQPGDLAIVREIHDRVWSEIARHWHAPSRQWAGPHSRSYQTLLSPQILGFLQRGLCNGVRLVANPPLSFQEALLPNQCPDRYLSFFAGEEPPRTERQKIVEGSPALEGVTHLARSFAVSSVERGTFWNQARALLAYGGGASGPAALQVRFLHDGYDYSSANLIAAQTGPEVLAAIGFASDGGDAHCNLDLIKNATVRAGDWRLRVELHGTARPPELPLKFSTTDEIALALGDEARAAFRIPWLKFGEFEPRWELTGGEGKTGLDLVLYHGPARDFVFDASFPCAIGLALSLYEDRAQRTVLNTVTGGVSGDCLFLEWPEAKLKAAMPLHARKEQEIVAFAKELKTRNATPEGSSTHE